MKKNLYLLFLLLTSLSTVSLIADFGKICLTWDTTFNNCYFNQVTELCEGGCEKGVFTGATTPCGVCIDAIFSYCPDFSPHLTGVPYDKYEAPCYTGGGGTPLAYCYCGAFIKVGTVYTLCNCT